MRRRLRRNLRHRWLGGVCSGFARLIGLDVFPIRMLIRFLFIAFVPMFWWVYLLLWIVIPGQRVYEVEADDVVVTTAKRTSKPIYRSQTRIEVQRLEFGDVVEMAEGKVSERVFKKVRSIDASVRALLPYFSWWRLLTQPELRTVKRAAVEYFPKMVQHYLNLPREYAENHKLASGVSAEEKLLADLGFIESTLNKVLEGVYSHEKVRLPDDLRRLNERINVQEPRSDDIGRTLDALVERIEGKVSGDILERVLSIRATIVSVLPQLSDMSGGVTQEGYNVRQTAQEYLPDALEKYLSLPEGFAETQRLSNGKTAKETLLEQLELLDETMKKIVGDVYQEDAQALLVHGRFLEEKFAGQAFNLPMDDLNLDKRFKVPDFSAQREEEKVRR